MNPKLTGAVCVLLGIGGAVLLLAMGQPPIIAGLCFIAGILAALRFGGRP